MPILARDYVSYARVDLHLLQISRGEIHKIANDSPNYRRIRVHSSRVFWTKFDITNVAAGESGSLLLRRFERLRARTHENYGGGIGFLLKARYKFGIAHVPPETRRAGVRESDVRARLWLR